ncbi:MAG TPA: thiamine-phosphate kinase [Vicinamibacteria bacterium]|nr:thiamine-phosphate kinase [Vicinamibacteria bacterium]
MKLSELGEDGFLRELEKRLAAPAASVSVGVGDDAAVVSLPADEQLILTTDALVEGVHFERTTLPPRFIGRRAVAVAVSDIAAMGGELVSVLLSIAVPRELEVEMLWKLVDGASERARGLGGSLVGGNLSRISGPMVVDVTACGSTLSRRVLCRSGARAGDALYLSGKIGASGVGLELLKKGVALGASGELIVPEALRTGPISLAEVCIRAHIDPEPRIALGRNLNRRQAATACIDVSDGLVIDLARLCRASSVGARIEETALPLSPGVLAWEREWGRDPLSRALQSGEDYELLFAVRDEDRLAGLRQPGEPELTRIGEATSETDRLEIVRRDGSVETLRPAGWNHFAPETSP